MSTLFPFPTGLYRAIGEEPVTVVAHDDNGAPTVVCVSADSAGERAVALVLLEDSPGSFVVSHGHRYFPDGRIEAYDPARPWYAGELRLAFDMEWVTLGPQPRVHVFAHTEQEWECARQVMKHLLQLERLSPLSYVESDHTGQDQGLFAQDVDGTPHGPGLVALIRESAYCMQNDLGEPPEWNEEEIHEEEYDNTGWEEEEEVYADEASWEEEERSDERWTEEAKLAEAAAPKDQCEELIQELSTQTSRRITTALTRWWEGSIISKRLP
jgi:hypothetical protein